MGLLILAIMTTWATGRRLEEQRLSELGRSAEQLIETLNQDPPFRTPGTGVFLDSRGLGIPRTLAAYYELTHALPERVILMTVITDPIPRVPANRRVTTSQVGPNILRVNAHYGFMQVPNVPGVLSRLDHADLNYVADETTFFVGRRTGHVTPAKGMPTWRKGLYAFLARNAEQHIRNYRLPVKRVLEVGVRYRL